MNHGRDLENLKDLQFHRRLMLIAGLVYFFWWFAVNALLPDAFNPFLGRALVVGAILLAWLFSFFSEWGKSHLRELFMAAAWLITFHYYYLFFGNAGEINWVIGTYITVTAIGFCFPTAKSLLSYSIFVLILSGFLMYLIPVLRASVFFPGLVTILLQANVGLWYRQRAEKAKLTAQNLAENVRVRDEFISLASHELKTPIASLKLQTQLIERGLQRGNAEFTNPAKLAEFVALFNRQVDRLTELVETMFDVSRISSGKFVLHPETVDLSQLVNEVVSLLHIPQHAPIQITAPDKVIVQADPGRMKQVIENLIINALKFGEEKPIEITVTAKNTMAEISVKDSGIGISPEFIDKIFDRFERAVSHRNISGLGLGLYIARQIVEAHRGQILVQSQLGQGTTMTVVLPLKKA